MEEVFKIEGGHQLNRRGQNQRGEERDGGFNPGLHSG